MPSRDPTTRRWIETRDFDTLSTGQINNEYYIDPSDDPQTVIDDLQADHGTGRAALLPGTHTFNSVTVPCGIVLSGLISSGDASTIKPDGDVDAVIIDPSSGADGAPNRHVARVDGVTIDCSDPASYTANAVTVLPGTPGSRQTVLRDVSFINDTPPDGTAILFSDPNGDGMAWTTTDDLWIQGFKHGIRKDAPLSGSFINSCRHKHVWMRAVENCVTHEGTTCRRNAYNISLQATSDTIRVFQGVDYPILNLKTFDASTISAPSNRGIVRVDTPVNNADELSMELDAGDPILQNIVVPSLRQVKIEGESVDGYDAGTNTTPGWLAEKGTGSLSFSDFRTSITTGSTSGNRKALESGNAPHFEDAARLNWQQTLGSTTDIFTVSGITDGSFQVAFVADPNNTLSTGITGNYIFRVVQANGTVVTETDTGVALSDGKTFMGVMLTAGGDGAIGTINRSTADNVAFGTSQGRYGVEFSVETKTSASKTLSLDNRVELRNPEV